MTTTYDDIHDAEGEAPTGPESVAASHAMTFVTQDGDRELVRMHVTGILPIPCFGDRIGVHGHLVSVTDVSTNYGRDESGQIMVDTVVRILAEGDTDL
ncbi:hypothetical protein DMB38_25940 [Streptomyces sp. WAC 06738]|nr:hypothetical protein DMB38_25940 [Streptomyces sp. WAC 06738]